MTNLISETKDDSHKISRLTRVKDEHAEIVKHEVRTKNVPTVRIPAPYLSGGEIIVLKA